MCVCPRSILAILACLVLVASIWDGCPCIRRRWISGKMKELPRNVTVAGLDTVTKDAGEVALAPGRLASQPSYDKAPKRFISIGE